MLLYNNINIQLDRTQLTSHLKLSLSTNQYFPVNDSLCFIFCFIRISNRTFTIIPIPDLCYLFTLLVIFDISNKFIQVSDGIAIYTSELIKQKSFAH